VTVHRSLVQQQVCRRLHVAVGLSQGAQGILRPITTLAKSAQKLEVFSECPMMGIECLQYHCHSVCKQSALIKSLVKIAEAEGLR
jgi:hypothetical protein